MASSIAEAMATATPLAKTKLTHFSLYNNALAFKLSDNGLRGRTFTISAAHSDRKLTHFIIREVPPLRAGVVLKRGIRRVGNDNWLSWIRSEFDAMEPFGFTQLPRLVMPTLEHGLIVYEATIPPDHPLAKPTNRRMNLSNSSAKPVYNDPFTETWREMLAVEDSINAFLEKHPEIACTVVATKRKSDRIRFQPR